MNATAAQTKSLEWLNRLRANPKIPLIVTGSAAVAVMVALILWAKAPDYRTLFSNLSDQDGGAIVSQLTQMNIPYRFSEASGAIEVPADKVHELRLRLAQQGLPKGGAVGFELLDQEKFGISQFSEQVNYQRALEGELSRTIETIGPVKGARVHLAMPKPSLFVREQKSPSASVTVNLLPGRALDEGQISAIVHLVSSAVAGLPPGNVTLVDQGGHLLTQSNTSGRDLNDAQLNMPAMSKAVFSGVLKRSCRLLLVTVIFTPRSRRNWTSPVKNKRKNSIALTVMNLMRRFVHASLMRASKAVPVIRAAYRGRCRINRHLRITRQSARLRQIKITASSSRAPPAIVGRVAHSGMKPVTTKSIAPFVIPK